MSCVDLCLCLFHEGQLGFSRHLVLSGGFLALQSSNDLSDISTSELKLFSFNSLTLWINILICFLSCLSVKCEAVD